MAETVKCQLCGEPMPKGETMFNYHGYAGGSCPKPPLPRSIDPKLNALFDKHSSEGFTGDAQAMDREDFIKAAKELLQDPSPVVTPAPGE